MNKKIRFIITGGTATVIDFSLLFLLKTAGIPAIFANFPATFVAMIFSFITNKKFTFQDSSKNHKKQTVLFLGFTLFGLWIIQPVIFLIFQDGAKQLFHNENIALFAVKILATFVTMVWNFITYDKFVFKNQ